MEERCPVCGKTTKKIINMPLFDGTGRSLPREVSCVCDCQVREQEKIEERLKIEEQQRRIAMLRGASLMDSKLKNARLSNFEKNNSNEKLFRIARNYIDNFDDMYSKNQGLLLWGNVGTGKSYTAACIANELIDKSKSVVMTSTIKLLDKILDFGEGEEELLYAKLSSCELLIIDDLGAERGTDFALEKVYDIIDSRYRTCKPLIVTTNLQMSQMKNNDDVRYSRVYDRIFELCYPVKVDGLSRRKQEAAKRYNEMKNILEG